MVGIESDEEVKVKSVIEQAKIPPDRYKILPLDQKSFAEYLSASDVLLANYPEDEHYSKFMSPIKMFAYIASGKPLITSKLDTLDVFNIDSVKMVPPDNVTAYSQAMLEVLEELPSLQISAQKNKSLVNQYSWQNRVSRIL